MLADDALDARFVIQLVKLDAPSTASSGGSSGTTSSTVSTGVGGSTAPAVHSQNLPSSLIHTAWLDFEGFPARVGR
jgi:hypothetical protein